MPAITTRGATPPPDPSAAAGQHGGTRTSGFGSTGFEHAPRPAAAPPSVFDVCHVGVVLRALLFVQGVIGIGVMFGAGSPADWLLRFAAASGAAWPGLLFWLIAACAGKRIFGALPLAGQWAVALALGAGSGAAGAALAHFASGDAPEFATGLAPALAGAALAGVVFNWLRMRALAALPADTSARLAELQSRIRPHFLFNTLNTALALVRHDPARAEGLLEDLAELFRVAMSDNAEVTTLAEEVELAQRYLAIEQVRFGARLQVTWDLDAAAGGARMPPLLLQPLVENAVRHGVEPAADGGSIRIRTRVDRGRVRVKITNSVPEAASRPGSGMALRNVRERLHLMHDVAAQFEARLEGGLFRVQIVVPL